jgi:hypothetical protein
MPSLSRMAVATALLALFAAPLARAAVESRAAAHSCCPERQPRPDPDAPCQQMAPTSCCLEVGVPPMPTADESLAAPALVLAVAPSPLAPAPSPLPRAVLTQADGPPLPPLVQTGVLLL